MSESVDEPLVVSPRRAQELLDIRNTKLYELIGSGELRSYVDGRTRKIIYASIKEHLARKAGVVRDDAKRAAIATRLAEGRRRAAERRRGGGG